LDKKRNIIISDFGFANRFQDDLLTTSCGSPVYAAPELVMDDVRIVLRQCLTSYAIL
jgi:protein-serine/threonine kinase